MNSTRYSEYGDDGAGAADMMAAFANAMRDVYTVGLGLFSSIAAAANASTGGMMPSARMMPDFLGTGGECMANNLRGASTQLADVAPYLAEAAVIAGHSGAGDRSAARVAHRSRNLGDGLRAQSQT